MKWMECNSYENVGPILLDLSLKYESTIMKILIDDNMDVSDFSYQEAKELYEEMNQIQLNKPSVFKTMKSMKPLFLFFIKYMKMGLKVYINQEDQLVIPKNIYFDDHLIYQFSKKEFTKEQFKSFVDEFVQYPLTNVQQLCINECRFSVDYLPDLVHFLSQKGQFLTGIDLSHNGFGDEFLIEFCKKTQGDWIQQLETLNLSGNALTSESIQAFSVLADSGCFKNLKTFSFSNNWLYDVGISQLFSVFTNNPCSQLHTLLLRDNQFGDRGLEQISLYFSQNLCPSLQILDLSYNNISPTGIRSLCISIDYKCIPVLRSLDLSYNEIEVEGIQVLCESFNKKSFKCLESLSFVFDWISDQGVELLITAIINNNITTFKHLNISCNEVGKKGIECIRNLLELPQFHMETINLSKNNRDIDTQESINTLIHDYPDIKFTI
ncbi:hypothetical protein WA158_004395 [Blastocystis sp. Blastoise]